MIHIQQEYNRFSSRMLSVVVCKKQGSIWSLHSFTEFGFVADINVRNSIKMYANHKEL